jgi:hypothetical protein
MDNKEIAKELAVACLSHEKFAAFFQPHDIDKAHAAGEKVGEFYNGIWKALQEEDLASSKGPTVHQF